MAVVAFAGRGVVRCPLTENLGAVDSALQALRPGDVRPGGTDLGAALLRRPRPSTTRNTKRAEPSCSSPTARTTARTGGERESSPPGAGHRARDRDRRPGDGHPVPRAATANS